MKSANASVPVGAAEDLRGWDIIVGPSGRPLAAFVSQKRKRLPNDNPIFVYLMRNNRNGYYKIGKSKNPIYREVTLQAEDPDVILILAVKCRAAVERDLHRHFARHRLRGEWFSLSAAQVEEALALLRIAENKL